MYENIPDEMKQRRNWVCWRYVKRGGKTTKLPVNPATGRMAKSNDPGTWADFETARRVADTDKFQGIGFMLSNSPYVGVDLDHCIEDGAFSETSRRILEAAASYAEISPSGAGVHILIRGDVPDGKGRRNAEIELYPAGRFFTMTGNVITGHETLRENQAAIDAIIQTIESERGRMTKSGPQSAETSTDDKSPAAGGETPGKETGAQRIDPVGISDAQLIARIRKSRQGVKFAALYDKGDTEPYGGDDSAADMALMNILAFWTGSDAARMEKLFSGSALGRREKWQQRKDYRQATVARAIQDTASHYTGQPAAREKSGSLLTDRPYTDKGMAERMMHLFGHVLRYCVEARRWYRYNGTLWEAIADFNVDRNVYQTLAETKKAVTEDWYRRDLVEMPTDEEVKRRKKVRGYLLTRENNAQTTAIIRAARDMAAIHAGAFDLDPWLLNCPNGIVNLKTFQLMPHDPRYLITKCTGAAPVPGKRSDLWEKTVADILPDADTRAWMQKFMGYCLTGSTREEKFLFLFGQGGSGKSTFLNAIARALGSYADTFPVEMLLTRRNDAGSGNESTPQLAKLRGVRLAITSEAPAGRRFNDARLKLWTGGDWITARNLYEAPITYMPHFKIVGSTNDMPAMIDAADEGMKRRLLIVPFEERLKQDTKLKESLMEPDHLAAVLTWCIEGCMRWQAEGLEPMPEAVRRRLFVYYGEFDDIGEFLETCCRKDPNMKTDSIDLYEHFCMIYGKTMSKNLFTRSLSRRGFPQGKANGRRVTAGLVYIGHPF